MVSELEDLFQHKNGRQRIARKRKKVEDDLLSREFVCWDGEGAKLDGPKKAQNYILFGNCKGDFVTDRDLSFHRICNLVIDTEKRFPSCYHVSFSFGYDINQIVKKLSRGQHIKLQETGRCRVGREWYVEWLKGKSFTITKREKDGTKTSATIYDVFSFFACSFVKAIREFLGDVDGLELVEVGKDKRSTFASMDDLDETILPYWRVEIQLLHQLVNALRERLYEAGLFIRRWYGPGALASFEMERQGVKRYMGEQPEEVRTAAQYAYAGGRFELLKLGHYDGPVWSLDINSAYPHAISQLPDLSRARWAHYVGASFLERCDNFPLFGLFRLSMEVLHPLLPQPSPLFHRDIYGRVFYPWLTHGWYWGPEAVHAIAEGGTVHEAWILESDAEFELPFGWVRDVYQRRQQWKLNGIPAQVALKLLLNSMYGKMAQRIGFNSEKMTAPKWHQLEWAGFVTSYVRSRIYQMMKLFGDSCIGTETDGLYVTQNPQKYGITSSNKLGEWEIDEYRWITYLQSGFYFLGAMDGSTESKYRGLDPKSINYGAIQDYLERVQPGTNVWPDIQATTTRFVGLGAANPNWVGYRNRFCRWEEEEPKYVTPGIGKRLHHANVCRACKAGISPANGLHDLAIGMPEYAEDMFSQPHAIPWRNENEVDWRLYAQLDEEMHS